MLIFDIRYNLLLVTYVLHNLQEYFIKFFKFFLLGYLHIIYHLLKFYMKYILRLIYQFIV